MRKCTLCKTEKPLSEFDGVTVYYCKPCRKIYRSSERERKNARALHLQRFYGIGLEEFDQLAVAQKQRCAICGCVPEKILRVDHNHQTKQLRGLLCDACNVGLGAFEDDLNRLEAAIEYLRRYQNVAA